MSFRLVVGGLAVVLLFGCGGKDVPPTIDNPALANKCYSIVREELGTGLLIGYGDEIELYGVQLQDLTTRMNISQFKKSSMELYSLSSFSHSSYDGYLLRITGKAAGSNIGLELSGSKAQFDISQLDGGSNVFSDPSFKRGPFQLANPGEESPQEVDMSRAATETISSSSDLGSVVKKDILYLYFDFNQDRGVAILNPNGRRFVEIWSCRTRIK